MSSFLTELKQNTCSRKSQTHVSEITLQVVNPNDPGTVQFCFHHQLLSEVTIFILLYHNYIFCYNTSNFSAWYTCHFSSCIQRPSQAVVAGFPNMESIFEDWAENENVMWSIIFCFHSLSCFIYTHTHIYKMCQIGLSVWNGHCTVTMICVG